MPDLSTFDSTRFIRPVAEKIGGVQNLANLQTLFTSQRKEAQDIQQIAEKKELVDTIAAPTSVPGQGIRPGEQGPVRQETLALPSQEERQQARLRLAVLDPQGAQALRQMEERGDAVELAAVQKQIRRGIEIQGLVSQEPTFQGKQNALDNIIKQRVARGEDPSESIRLRNMNEDDLNLALEKKRLAGTAAETILAQPEKDEAKQVVRITQIADTLIKIGVKGQARALTQLIAKAKRDGNDQEEALFTELLGMTGPDRQIALQQIRGLGLKVTADKDFSLTPGSKRFPGGGGEPIAEVDPLPLKPVRPPAPLRGRPGDIFIDPVTKEVILKVPKADGNGFETTKINPKDYTPESFKAAKDAGDSTLLRRAKPQEIAPFSPERSKQEKEIAETEAKSDIEKAIEINQRIGEINANTPAGIAKQRLQDEKVAEIKRDQRKREMRKDAKAAKAFIVEGKVDEALALANKWFSTGFLGQMMSSIGGTDAFNLAATIKTITANIGFEELQAMRDASPTGGALGQVAVQELEALQSTLANLDPAQDDDILIENLKQVKVHIQKWKKAVDDAADLAAVERSGTQGNAGPIDTGRTTPEGFKIFKRPNGSTFAVKP